jgi:hypothetical protein
VVLELREINGFHLGWGDTLNFLRAGSVSGSFAGFVNGTSLQGLSLANFDFDGGVFGFNPDAQLPPVPEPSTWALMLAGLLTVAMRARRGGPGSAGR